MKIDFERVRAGVGEHPFWCQHLAGIDLKNAQVGIHLAVFVEPFLSLLRNGKKTTESRFSRVKCAPFEEVSEGDIILIKKAGGPICGVALASKAWSYDLAIEPLDRIKSRHGHAISASESFWQEKRDAHYATLIELSHHVPLAEISVDKRDRRGWVSLISRQQSMAF